MNQSSINDTPKKNFVPRVASLIKISGSPEATDLDYQKKVRQNDVSSSKKRDRMQESTKRVYDGRVDAPAGLDSPGPIKYASTWAVEDSRSIKSKLYSIPKQKRELKFNSANGEGICPTTYSPNSLG